MKAVGLIAVLAGAVATVSAEINLTPTRSFRELEGCKFPQLEFRDDGRKITYEAPPGWEPLLRDTHTLALVPPGKEMVSAKIKFIPTPGRLVLDAAQLQYFKDTAYQLVPREGRVLAEPTVTPNPLIFGNHPTCEVDFYFVHQSQRLRMSVLFVDLGESQLRFSLISRPGDFEDLHNAFRASWYSWQWAEPTATVAAAP